MLKLKQQPTDQYDNSILSICIDICMHADISIQTTGIYLVVSKGGSPVQTVKNLGMSLIPARIPWIGMHTGKCNIFIFIFSNEVWPTTWF